MMAPVPESSASNASRPSELGDFLEFISDDDRPTFVLEQSPTPNIIFRNLALDALVQDTSQEARFLGWVGTLSTVAGDTRIEHPGTYLSRAWSSKRFGGEWTVVFGRQLDSGHDKNKALVETQLDNGHGGLAEQRTYTQRAEAQKEHPNDTNLSKSPLLDQFSSSDSNTLASTSTPTPAEQNVDAAGPLGDLVVDWLLFPQFTPDPWIHFLTAHDWSKSAAGPMESWSPILRQMYSLILDSNEPRVIYWGPDLLMFYNSAAKFLVGQMHPSALGNPLVKVWNVPLMQEITDILRSGIIQGKSLPNKRHEFVLDRHGFMESTFFDFIFLSIPSPDDGRFLGFLNEFTEVTEVVLQDSRHDVSKALLEKVVNASHLDEFWTGLLHTLEQKSKDVSYALVYCRPPSVASPNDASSCRLQAAFGVEGVGSSISPAILTVMDQCNNEIAILEQGENTLPPELAVPVSGAGVVRTACILPIVGVDGHQLSAIVVLGLSPTRPLNSSSRQFVESLRDLVFKSSVLFSLPLERRRVQEIVTSLSRELELVTDKAKKSEQNFTRLVHNAPMGMGISRNDGYPIYVNQGYLDLLSMSRTEYYKAAQSGLAWRSAIFEDDVDLVNRIWMAAIKTGKHQHMEFRVKSPSCPAGFRWLESSLQQHFDENDQLICINSWLTDISSRKQRLADALENKRSSENFIDMVSHEIRNPLSAILQLADNILLSLPPIEQENQSSILTTDARNTLVDTAQTIHLCARHQKSIIDEVLTFSKLDSKLLLLAPEIVQPSAIVESVLKMVKAELDHADIRGSLDIQQSYRDLGVDRVLVDPGRLSQVIVNLMTNAIKFTKNSSKRQIVIGLGASRTRPTAANCRVTLIESRKDRPDGPAVVPTINKHTGEEIYLTFRVQDTGCGLSEDEIKHLFHRFSQASPKTYQQYGGSGLGLFISRELVELQGGQIGVTGKSAQGSTFAFYIKATRVEAAPDVPQPSAKLAHTSIPMAPLGQESVVEDTSTVNTKIQDLHVLVVEDNSINAKVICQQLRKLGAAAVHVAGNGLEALNLLSTTTFFTSGKTPLSVVLLDVEMPVMDGLTCARRIRELEKTKEILRHVPVIGITANARTDQIASCIEAGMDEVVTKPFRLAQDVVPRMLVLVDQHISAGQ